MVVKFISNKKGGSSKSIDYLLNEREAQGTARTLQGDPTITRKIINNITRKQKVTMGVMSFEEANIKEELKYKLMSDLEKTMFPGMSKDEYNILWVEHTDKGRLELNFVIPKEHLPTQKALQPYYHIQDLARFEKLEKIMNIEHNFSDPQDPGKKRTLEINNKEIHLSKDYIELDNTLHQLVAEGKIQNRQQMIELLKENDIQVTREAKESLSIKLPDSKRAKRFKGDIYNEQFRSPEQLKEFSIKAEQRARAYNNRDTQSELKRLKQDLEKYNTDKAQKLRRQYSRPIKEHKIEQLQRVSISDNSISNNRDRDRSLHSRADLQQDDNREHISREENPQRVANTTNNAVHLPREKVYKSFSGQGIDERRRNNIIHKGRGIENDSIGTTTKTRESKYQSPEFRAYREARKARGKLHKTVIRTANSIRTTSIEDSRRELNIKQEAIRQSNDNIESITEFTRPLRGYALFRERVSDYISIAQQYILEKVQDFKSRYDKNFVFKQDDLEQSLKEEVISFKQLDRVADTFKSAANRDIKQEEQEEQEEQQQQQQQRSRGYGMSL